MSRDTSTGLLFEEKTNIKNILKNINLFIDNENNIFDINKNYIGIYCPKNLFYKKFLKELNIEWSNIISSKLLPDDAVYIEQNKTIYIYEKKYQETNGSADEKLQTCDFKKKQYEKLLKDKNIHVEYIYVLNDWFKKEKYVDVLSYIKSVGCSYCFNEINFEYK